MMHRIASLSALLLFVGMTAASAQFPPQPAPPAMPGSEQERAACRPDVVRYCQAQLSTNQDDVFAILGCLQRNRNRLSAACHQVLADHGQ